MGVLLTINLAEDALATLDEIAAARDLSRASLIEQALGDFVAAEAKQMANTLRDDVASGRRGPTGIDELERIFAKYRTA
jgi:predicted transcriptional regulator